VNADELMAMAGNADSPPLPPEIAGYQDDQVPEVRGPWRPVKRTEYDWAFLRLSECQAEADAIEEQFKAALARLEKRRDELASHAIRGVSYFTFVLKEAARANRDYLLRGTKKTAEFLHGAISWRKLGGRLTVSDPKALAEWLAAQPIESGLYRVELKPEMRALQDHCKRTGEVPPGTVWGEEYDEIYIKAEPLQEAIERKP